MDCQPETEDEDYEEVGDEVEIEPLEDDEGCSDSDPEGDELLPDCSLDPEDVELLNVPYCTRAAGDWVSAGTLDSEYEARAIKKGLRRLRYFPSWQDAENWAREFFGDRFKGRVMDAVNSGCHMWAFLIAGPRGELVHN